MLAKRLEDEASKLIRLTYENYKTVRSNLDSFRRFGSRAFDPGVFPGRPSKAWSSGPGEFYILWTLAQLAMDPRRGEPVRGFGLQISAPWA